MNNLDDALRGSYCESYFWTWLHEERKYRSPLVRGISADSHVARKHALTEYNWSKHTAQGLVYRLAV